MVGSLTSLEDLWGDEARDLLFLDSLPGVGPSRVQKLVRTFGGAERALRAPFTDFASVAGSAAARARTDAQRSDCVGRALARAHELGMTVLTWGSPQYPPDLFHLADPPPLLFLKGRVELLARRRAVTVVGSRRVTTRGREVARTIGRELARAGSVVVSGLALGTDGQAHRGALDADGDTVAVLGAGADVAYPRTHARLHRAISERGLLVSEFTPGTRAAPYHFPRRNRVLAALGVDGTVVVEAGERSGSLITVDHALDLGRDVWAVPGPIDGPACAGSNRLLTDGAQTLATIDEFVAAVTERGPDAKDSEGSRVPPEDAMLRLLRDEPLEPGELAARCGRSVPEVLAALTALELSGQVVRLPGSRYRSAA